MDTEGPVAPPTTTDPGTSTGLSPAVLLRAEGLALLVIAVLAYAQLEASWWLFAALILAPDLGLLGYLIDPRWGARTYNLTHTLALPVGLATFALALALTTVLAVALVWTAHIGMDRAAGFGLKYPTRFGDTHLQRVR